MAECKKSQYYLTQMTTRVHWRVFVIFVFGGRFPSRARTGSGAVR